MQATCPHCGAAGDVPDGQVGKTATCRCGKQFVVATAAQLRPEVVKTTAPVAPARTPSSGDKGGVTVSTMSCEQATALFADPRRTGNPSASNAAGLPAWQQLDQASCAAAQRLTAWSVTLRVLGAIGTIVSIFAVIIACGGTAEAETILIAAAACIAAALSAFTLAAALNAGAAHLRTQARTECLLAYLADHADLRARLTSAPHVED
jgi:hypothetical protein